MFEDLLRNRFVQSLGVGALVYLLMMSLNWAMLFLLRALETFSAWYRYRAAPYTFQVAIGLAIAYLIVSAVFSSKRN